MKKLSVNKSMYSETIDYSTFWIKIVEEDIKPWLLSFENFSFVKYYFDEDIAGYRNGHWIFDINSNFFNFKIDTDITNSTAKVGMIRFSLCCKDNYDRVAYITIASAAGNASYNSSTKMHYFSRDFFAISKDNNLTTLFLSDGLGSPDKNEALIFDKDFFGEDYIVWHNSSSSHGYYLKDSSGVLYNFKDYFNKTYTSEDFIYVKRFSISYTDTAATIKSLSTNILNINNTFLKTNFKVIEVNGIKYRKIDKNIWIKDDDN